MIILRYFVRSWYGKPWLMMLMAATSAFLITFYTTSQSLASSLTLEKHLIVFAFSFVLMLLAVVPIAYVIFTLDAHSYLRQHEPLRYIIQFVILVYVLGAVALRVVYKIYFVLFGVDLQQAEYFERDFTVVMFCLIMIQFYYAIRKERKMNSFRKRRIMLMEVQLSQLERKLKTAELKHKELIRKYESELAELKGRKQRLRTNYEQLSIDENRLKACLKEAAEQFVVMIGAKDEWVRIPQVAYFHLKEGSARSKLVDVRLLDGREGTVDMDSLAKIEKQWPNLFFRAGRGILIQHLAIKDQYKEDGDCIIELFGKHQERIKVPAEAYDRLLKIKEQWTQISQKEGGR